MITFKNMKTIKLISICLLFWATDACAQDKQVPTPHWRLLYHFTPPVNWTNNPDGLIVLNGVFQLYLARTANVVYCKKQRFKIRRSLFSKRLTGMMLS